MLDLDGANAVTQRRLYGSRFDEPVARRDAGGGVSWYGADGLGSVRQVFDNSGNQVGSRGYTGFGAVAAASGGGFDRYAFTAAGTDALTGLVGEAARQYDPGLGRWTSEDPIGFAGGDATLSRYVGNSSTNATDPSGLEDKRTWFEKKLDEFKLVIIVTEIAVNTKVDEVKESAKAAITELVGPTQEEANAKVCDAVNDVSKAVRDLQQKAKDGPKYKKSYAEEVYSDTVIILSWAISDWWKYLTEPLPGSPQTLGGQMTPLAGPGRETGAALSAGRYDRALVYGGLTILDAVGVGELWSLARNGVLRLFGSVSTKVPIAGSKAVPVLQGIKYPTQGHFYPNQSTDKFASQVSKLPRHEKWEGFYDVAIHGTKDGKFATQALGDIEPKYFTAQELADAVRRRPDYNGQPIRLITCNTGKESEKMIADFARAIKQDVYAPTNIIHTIDVSTPGSVVYAVTEAGKRTMLDMAKYGYLFIGEMKLVKWPGVTDPIRVPVVTEFLRDFWMLFPWR